MTKQHFIAFAADIRSQVEKLKTTFATGDEFGHLKAAIESECDLVCRIAPQFNPRFNEKCFRDACGL